jgi:phage recombination protein Bet
VAPAIDYGKLIPWSPEQVQLIKDTVARDAGLSNAELALFGYVAGQYGLDPLRRQMYAVRYEGKDKPVTFQVAIDGFRALAKRSGKMRGYTPTQWCGQDGEWVDVWTRDDLPPWAARVGVRHADYGEPVYGTAIYTEYVATRWATDNEQDQGAPPRVPNSQWTMRPAHMLAKCAEALAIRQAFPEDVGGLYTDDEMEHAPRVTIDGTATDVTAGGGGQAPEDERFGANKASIDQLLQVARDAGQKANGNLKLVTELADWPKGKGSVKEGLADWARLRPEEDVVVTLRTLLDAVVAKTNQPEPAGAPEATASADATAQPSLIQ